MVSSASSQPAATSLSRPVAVWPWTLLALLAALGGTAGSLWLTSGMNLRACPLCLYERTFMIAALTVLMMGLLTRERFSSLSMILALPAAVGGLGVAGFHVYLELTGTLECPSGVFGVGSAPQQSLTVFILLLLVMIRGAWLGRNRGDAGMIAILAALVLGALAAAATIRTAPPMPSPPTKPYEQPMDICRPPFVANS